MVPLTTYALTVFVCVSVLAPVANAAPDFIVATNGSDAWSGALAEPNAEGTDGPFATLARARDAVRSARVAAPEPRSWTVELRDGAYEVSEPLTPAPEDSGSDGDHALVFMATPGEHPVILTHNEICDIVYSGISVGWSWGYAPSGAHHNIIEWNHIHHLGLGVLSELSAIYTLGVSPGTRIANNLLHDTYDYRYGSWGIGLDEGTSGVTVENNIVYNHGYGIGLHYGHGNLIRNNVAAFCRGHDLINGGKDDGAWSMRVDGNIFLSDAGVITSSDWHARSKSTSDRNVFWDTEAGPDTDLAGLLLDEWQATTGQDAGSLVADPLFVDATAHDFRLREGSPAKKVGFRPFDLSSAGLYGDPDWVAAPGRIELPPIPEDALRRLGPLVRFEDGFEDTDVGAPPRGTQVNGETNGASVRVTDEVARTGSRSLRLVDAAGLEATWQPHFVYNPSVVRGVVELSFDARLDDRAVLVATWRDWRGEMLTGPLLTLRGGGRASTGDRDVADVPPGEWVHAEMMASIGTRAQRTWRLTLTHEDGTFVRVDDVPMGSATFRRLTWIGFISDADGPAEAYLDNIRLRYGETEADLE